MAGGKDGIHRWTLPDGQWSGDFLRAKGTAATNSIGRVKSMRFIDQGQRLLVGAEDAVPRYLVGMSNSLISNYSMSNEYVKPANCRVR